MPWPPPNTVVFDLLQTHFVLQRAAKHVFPVPRV